MGSASPVFIIDEFPPHAWQGANACIAPGVIHEHVPHRARSEREEVCAVRVLHARLVHEPQICLVD